jgi:hypothetical protein
LDFPIKNGDFPVRYVKLPEGNLKGTTLDALLKVTRTALPTRNLQASEKRLNSKPSTETTRSAWESAKNGEVHWF